MTTRRRTRRSSGRSRAIRTIWEFLTPQNTALAGNSSTASDLTADIANIGHSTKIIRLIGHIQVNNPTVDGRYEWFAGISVVTLDAFTAGELPDPRTDSQQSWYYWAAGSPDSPIGNNSFQGPEKTAFDIRTQRVLRPGFRLVLVFETGANPGSLSIQMRARALWQQT